MSMSIKSLCKKAHKTACEKGWHDKEVSISDYVANLHGEVSEVFECHRDGLAPTTIVLEESGKLVGIPIELADIFLRIADMCEKEGIDLENAIAIKMKYNETRTYRHGGKVV